MPFFSNVCIIMHCEYVLGPYQFKHALVQIGMPGLSRIGPTKDGVEGDTGVRCKSLRSRSNYCGDNPTWQPWDLVEKILQTCSAPPSDGAGKGRPFAIKRQPTFDNIINGCPSNEIWFSEQWHGCLSNDILLSEQ